MKLSIYYGKLKPIVAVGKNQYALLHFLSRYPGWHTMSQDRATKRAIVGLVNRESIVYDQTTHMARVNYGG
jgi:hypothetical protein